MVNILESIVKRESKKKKTPIIPLERKELRAKEKEIFQETFEKEKKKVRLERQEVKLKRAEERAKRAAQNPLFRRIVKKAGVIGKRAVKLAAVEVGKQFKGAVSAQVKVRERKEKIFRQELGKVTAKAERTRVKGELERKSGFFGLQTPKIDTDRGPDLLGTRGEAKPLKGLGDFNPLGPSSSGNLLDTGKKKGKNNFLL